MITNTQQLAALLKQADEILMSAECHQWMSTVRKEINSARNALTKAMKLVPTDASPHTPDAQAGQVPECSKALLERLANWCEDQAASDWYGSKASDMVSAFSDQFATAPQPRGGDHA